MRGFWSVYPYQAHLRATVHCERDLYSVAVYHPADGHHESAVLQVARCGPRAILLQRGPERTAGYKHEQRRQKDKTDHSRTKSFRQ